MLLLILVRSEVNRTHPFFSQSLLRHLGSFARHCAWDDVAPFLSQFDATFHCVLCPSSCHLQGKKWTPYTKRSCTLQKVLNLNIVWKEWKHLLFPSDSEALRLTGFNNILSVSCCHLSMVQHVLLLLPLFSNLSLNCRKKAKQSLCISMCSQSSRREKVTNENLCVCISTVFCYLVDFCELCSLASRPWNDEYKTIGLNVV